MEDMSFRNRSCMSAGKNSLRIQGGVSLLFYKIFLPVKNKQKIKADTETPPCIRRDGSYMAELSVLLPFFAGFMAMLLLFFQVLAVQQEVGDALLASGRELSVLACTGDSAQSSYLFGAKAIFLKNLKEDSAAEAFVRQGRRGISLFHSDFTGNYIFLQADYKIRLPFGLFGKRDINMTQKFKCRKWTGQSALDSTEEEIVYITPQGSVYHKNRSCSYLKPSVKSADADTVGNLRSEDGSKYYPCAQCVKNGIKNSTTVYITGYGNRYHSRRDCSKINHLIYAVRLSEIGDRKVCSKCGRE